MASNNDTDQKAAVPAIRWSDWLENRHTIGCSVYPIGDYVSLDHGLCDCGATEASQKLWLRIRWSVVGFLHVAKMKLWWKLEKIFGMDQIFVNQSFREYWYYHQSDKPKSTPCPACRGHRTEAPQVERLAQ